LQKKNLHDMSIQLANNEEVSERVYMLVSDNEKVGDSTFFFFTLVLE
jgi:hypothetical protein